MIPQDTCHGLKKDLRGPIESALGIPAVQLINEGAEYSMLTNNNQHILVAPAFQWLSQLP